MRRTWLGTPVRDIFILETPQDLLRHSELVCRLYRAMCLNFRSDLEAAREWIDDDGNGYLSMDELQEVCARREPWASLHAAPLCLTAPLPCASLSSRPACLTPLGRTTPSLLRSSLLFPSLLFPSLLRSSASSKHTSPKRSA